MAETAPFGTSQSRSRDQDIETGHSRQLYEGLPGWTKIVIILTGFGLGCAIIIFSSLQASEHEKSLAYSDSDARLLATIANEAKQQNCPDVALLVHALNVQVHLKGITNRQAIAVPAVGAGIALLAIGFYRVAESRASRGFRPPTQCIAETPAA